MAKDRKNKAYTLSLRPHGRTARGFLDHLIALSYKTIISLRSYTPVPTFENHLIIHGELES